MHVQSHMRSENQTEICFNFDQCYCWRNKGKTYNGEVTQMSDVSFGLFPEAHSYEV